MKTMLLKRIPEDIHTRFKACCAMERTTMTDKLIALMQEASAGTINSAAEQSAESVVTSGTKTE